MRAVRRVPSCRRKKYLSFFAFRTKCLKCPFVKILQITRNYFFFIRNTSTGSTVGLFFLPPFMEKSRSPHIIRRSEGTYPEVGREGLRARHTSLKFRGALSSCHVCNSKGSLCGWYFQFCTIHPFQWPSVLAAMLGTASIVHAT